MNILLLIVLPGVLLGIFSFFAARRGWLRPSVASILMAVLYPFLATSAWIVSRHLPDPSQVTFDAHGTPSALAIAGFPINGLQIMPFAGGFKSIQNIDVIFIHQLFWLAVAVIVASLIAYFIPKDKLTDVRWLLYLVVPFVTVANLALLALWFD